MMIPRLTALNLGDATGSSRARNHQPLGWPDASSFNVNAVIMEYFMFGPFVGIVRPYISLSIWPHHFGTYCLFGDHTVDRFRQKPTPQGQ